MLERERELEQALELEQELGQALERERAWPVLAHKHLLLLMKFMKL